jgi:hypothetical protein
MKFKSQHSNNTTIINKIHKLVQNVIYKINNIKLFSGCLQPCDERRWMAEGSARWRTGRGRSGRGRGSAHRLDWDVALVDGELRWFGGCGWLGTADGEAWLQRGATPVNGERRWRTAWSRVRER